MTQNPDCRSENDAKNRVCEDFLQQYGAGNFVRTAAGKFRSVQYFTCSALGHNEEGVAFQSTNVLAPFLWILSTVDSTISAQG